VNSSNLDMVGQAIIDKKIEDKEIERFRNGIRNTNSISLAIKFHELMEGKGVSFDEPVYTQEQLENDKNAYHRNAQDNLDLLFKRDELLKQVKKIFDDNGGELNWDDVHDIENALFSKSKFSSLGVISSPLRLVYELLRGRHHSKASTINYESVSSFLHHSAYILIYLINKLTNQYTGSQIA